MGLVSSHHTEARRQAHRPGPLSPALNDWLPVRGQATEKLCVRMSMSLCDRVDHARQALRCYPGLAKVLRSRNTLVAYACHRLRVDLEDHGFAPGAPGQPVRTHEHSPGQAFEENIPDAGHAPARRERDRASARWLPEWTAGAPLYRTPWEANFAEPQAQFTLRVPPPFAARLRELFAELAAAPRASLRPELAAVATFSDLVALSCHELCRLVETDPAVVDLR